MKNFDVLIIKGKGYVEVRPNGVDKGSVVRRILNRHNSNLATPLDFVLVLGDDVADEAMFGMVQTMMEQDQQQMHQNPYNMPDKLQGKTSKQFSGTLPHDASQYSSLDDYRRQYRSFRKGSAKGAKGEITEQNLFSELFGAQRLPLPAKSALGGKGGKNVGLPGAIGSVAGPAVSTSPANVFTVTVGRKPSEASFYYDTPDDVVELLASMVKVSVMYGHESKQQRSMSLSDLSQYAYRHASSMDNKLEWLDQTPASILRLEMFHSNLFLYGHV